MPIYSYRCPKCGLEEEKILPIKHSCQYHCDMEMERVFNPIQFIMRWSTKDKVTDGINNNSWMKDDYKKRAMSGFERHKAIF